MNPMLNCKTVEETIEFLFKRSIGRKGRRI